MHPRLTDKIPGPKAPELSLFESTSKQAQRKASLSKVMRYLQILSYLKERPGCLFEIATALSTPDKPVFDHQISGRFTDMMKAGVIERTGHRRKKPSTGCSAEEYRITLLGLSILADGLKDVQTPSEGGGN